MLPVFVELAEVPSFVSSADEGVEDVLVDTKGAVDVLWEGAAELPPALVNCESVELLTDLFVSESVLDVTVVAPERVVVVLVLFTPLSGVIVVTGEEPFSLCVVVIVVVVTLPALSSVAELAKPVVFEVVLLLAFNAVTVVVVVVTVVTAPLFELVFFVAVTNEGISEVVPVLTFFLVKTLEEIEWPRSDTIITNWCE
ncbi:unnamed protein product [Peronospora farinosa]|uniref:Uncharacterized protein n=1 Tax=Peronospora farinosa TaxID=134698 RepID=A0AAV0T786_9STRA|nr:unnamed protein product [Peronospora farinosa]